MAQVRLTIEVLDAEGAPTGGATVVVLHGVECRQQRDEARVRAAIQNGEPCTAPITWQLTGVQAAPSRRLQSHELAAAELADQKLQLEADLRGLCAYMANKEVADARSTPNAPDPTPQAEDDHE